MTTKQTTEQRRQFETSLDIAASRDDVWRALTEAEELMRWFPLRAEVTPGPGGSMLWAWDESWDWRSRIEVWEPGRRLRLVQDDYRPADTVEPSRVVMEFTLESHAGKTRLRFVHSGFGRGAAWDNELESISEGWPAELRSLRLYVERHRGRDRHAGKATVSVTASRQAVWDQLTGSGGYRLEPPAPEVGRPFEVTTPGGETLRGTVEVYLPRQSLTGIVPELDDALFRLATWRDAAGNAGAWVSLATYTDDTQRVRGFEREAAETLRRLFPNAKQPADRG